MQAIKQPLFNVARIVLKSTRCRVCENTQRVVCTQWSTSRYSTEAAMAPPHITGDDKIFDPKIEEIVNQIGSLTLLEVADLNQLLKKTLNISDAPVMMTGGAAVAAPKQEEDDEVEVKQEKSLFTLTLIAFTPDKKVPLIKEIKSLIPGTNLVQAKKFVESLPQKVQSELTKEDVEKMQKTLEAVGAKVEVE